MYDCRHEDFEIVNNAVSTRRVVESFGFKVNKKGFMPCPFHKGGMERTPSLKIYPGSRGFHCKACGTGGDNSEFVELYLNISSLDAVKELSNRFHIPISTDSDISPETIERAKQARFEQQKAITLEQQKLADLKRLGTLIQGCEREIKESEPFSDTWCYCQNKLPILRGEWEMLFNSIIKRN